MNWTKLSFSGIKHHDKVLAIGLFVIFLLLFCWQILRLWLPQNERRVDSSLERPLVIKPALSEKALVFQRSLFGEYVAEGMDDSQIGHSTLDMTIEGIIYSAMQKEALVSIRSADGEVKTYAVGDKLPGGAVIKKIRKESVVLEYHGKLESLSLPVNELRFEKPAKPLFEE